LQQAGALDAGSHGLLALTLDKNWRASWRMPNRNT
jgi:16S rRNA U516 pseudouridylate synthase RsuA-like enzyme